MSRTRSLRAIVGFIAAVLGVAACGGSPITPPPTGPQVTAVTPSAGTTSGGTTLTISGTNFAAGATVLIGGAAAGAVSVVNATTITAVTPPHASGAVDVVVAVNGQSASLAGGYTYSANSPPVIVSIVVKGSKPREPAQFADLDETVSVTAVVTDVETPVSQLTFSWTADAGTFTGSGPAVTWTAPHAFATPATLPLTLTVTERYQVTNNVGQPVTGENQTRGTTSLRLHDSVKEVSELAVDFLTAFSQQLDPNVVVRNFTSNCAGAANELSDTICEQQEGTVVSYTVGAPSTIVGFTGSCSFRSEVGDACALVPMEWHTRIKAGTCHPVQQLHVGQTQNTTGTDQVTAVLEDDRWRLCASDFDTATNSYTSVVTTRR